MKIPLLFITLPLGSAFLVALLGRKVKHLGDITANLSAFCLFIAALFCLPRSLAGTQVYTVNAWLPPAGISLANG